MTDDALRWGVLGCADIALRRVIPALQMTPGNSVVAIASRDRVRAQAVATELGIDQPYGSYADLLGDDHVDAIYIPLPNSLHAEWTVRSAEAGKHVLCEKPMAMTVAECNQMVAACQRANVQLMEAFMYRFHPQHARAQALIAAGAIGEPKLMRSSFCVRMNRPSDDIRFSPSLGGGALFDVGVYAIDAVRWLLGADPLSVAGHLALDSQGVDLSATASLRFANDVLAIVACSFVANSGGSYEIVGPEGKLTVHQAFAQPPGKPPVITWPGGEEAFPPDINQYQLMVESFATALREGRPPPFPANQGTGNIAIIDSLRRAPPSSAG
jgi:predicted dehydrogenase